MQNCLLPLIVTMVYIVLSITTLLSESRPVKTVCLLRCAKEKAELKVISDDCVQSCQKELILGHTNDARKEMIEKSIIRIPRSIDSMNAVINECKMSPHYPKPQEVKGLAVEFLTNHPHIKISWKAIDHSQTDFNWTTYAVIYTHSTRKKVSCKVVPKNQTQYLVPEEDWTSPDPFYAEVVTHPYNEESSVKLKTFEPRVTKITFTPSVPTKDTTKLVASIAGGVIAGLVLFLVLYFIIKCKKKRPNCHGIHVPPPSLPSPLREEEPMYYACYYPEGEEFRKEVASIVNYFRHNGYNVKMDVMDSGDISSQGPTRWAESQMRNAKKVLVFLTPALVNLSRVDGMADSSQSQDINRVWIELEVLRDIYTRERSANKMVCITLPGASVKSMTLPLWAKVSYKWSGDAKEILKRLNGRPPILPVLGNS